MNKTTTISKLFGVIPLISIGLILWEITIYRLTFIPWGIPACIAIVTGVIMTPVLRKIIDGIFPGHSLMVQLLYNIVTWGGIVMFLFMWTNYQFAGSPHSKINAPFVKVDHLSRRRGVGEGQPYVTILYKGQEQHLLFDKGTNTDSCKSADLTLADGLFGYVVVVDKTLRVK